MPWVRFDSIEQEKCNSYEYSETGHRLSIFPLFGETGGMFRPQAEFFDLEKTHFFCIYVAALKWVAIFWSLLKTLHNCTFLRPICNLKI